MRRWKHWLGVMAVAAALGCSSDNSGPGDNGGDGNGPPSGTGTVTVGNNFFNPSSVTVATNGTVTWNWNSNGVSHNVTFDAGGPNSPTQSSGSFSRTFATAGTFPYHCTIHGTAMSGTVVVQQSSGGSGGTGY